VENKEQALKGSAWPRITMVTAVRNGARYVEDTICSILSQGYPNLEYFVVDGASTDGTQAIIRRYERELAGWISEPDKGVYDALNKGFAMSTGEIMGWLNASDMLHTKGLFVVGSVFADLREVEWITGRPSGFSAEGFAVQVAPQLPRWSRYGFLLGANKYIQQESTFWRRRLWERAGGRVDPSLRAEGDFDLWVRFFRHAQHFSVDALVGGYRSHDDALSASDIARYNRTCEEIIERELQSERRRTAIRLFRRMDQQFKRIPIARWLWFRVVEAPIFGVLGRKASPIVELRENRWSVRR